MTHFSYIILLVLQSVYYSATMLVLVLVLVDTNYCTSSLKSNQILKIMGLKLMGGKEGNFRNLHSMNGVGWGVGVDICVCISSSVSFGSFVVSD